jgi:hypothetical protein
VFQLAFERFFNGGVRHNLEIVLPCFLVRRSSGVLYVVSGGYWRIRCRGLIPPRTVQLHAEQLVWAWRT